MCLLAFIGCESTEQTQDNSGLDCRNNGLGCTTGFTCQLNSEVLYECLPDAQDRDARLDIGLPLDIGLTTMSDVGTIPDSKLRDNGHVEADLASPRDAAITVDQMSRLDMESVRPLDSGPARDALVEARCDDGRSECLPDVQVLDARLDVGLSMDTGLTDMSDVGTMPDSAVRDTGPVENDLAPPRDASIAVDQMSLRDMDSVMPLDIGPERDVLVEARCDDGRTNGDETDRDCGGVCSPCDDGLACSESSDCLSDVCLDERCQEAMCGDGVINGLEECDDENQVDEDACTNGCQAAGCGDGIVWRGQEECDGGDLCDVNCTLRPQCPDGILNEAGECVDPLAASCFELLTPADEPNPDFIFSACPATISVAQCRAPMMALLQRNRAIELCPYQSGAAAGEGWCPVRGFEAPCFGYVGTGGDENTACETGVEEFARAFMRNARTDDERASCAVVTAVMSHEGGFAPTAKSWDMFCNGGETGAIGLFQFDFASGLDPLPAGVDAQFEQFFRGVRGPTIATLAQAWMACNPRIAGATAATRQDLDLATAACRAAGAPEAQLSPGQLGCRFVGVAPGPGGGEMVSTIRCGRDWVDANGRCGTPCLNNEGCENGERCYADLSLDPCSD